MAVVWIPSLLQPLTGGEEKVDVPGETLLQVIDQLEDRFPGIKARLCEGDKLRPSMTAVIDGLTNRQGLRRRLEASSEIHFLPAMSGGA
jgi:molybdopterin synthase sulfur carrier subunit